VTGAEQASDGKLVMKKGNRFRIEMEQQTIVTDGATVWSYTPSTNQVLIDRFRADARSMTPEKLLIDLPKNSTATEIGKEKSGGRELTILKLVPTASSAPYSWMKLWVDTDESTASKIQVSDRAGNLTTYTVTELRINRGVPESSFRFSIPAGADSVDLR
jgi:outer membrane lipoprotein carrier protein